MISRIKIKLESRVVPYDTSYLVKLEIALEEESNKVSLANDHQNLTLAGNFLANLARVLWYLDQSFLLFQGKEFPVGVYSHSSIEPSFCSAALAPFLV